MTTFVLWLFSQLDDDDSDSNRSGSIINFFSKLGNKNYSKHKKR